MTTSRNNIVALLLLTLPMAAYSQGKSIGMQYLTSKIALYDSIQKNIHSYAELGYQEYRSSRLLIDHLKENGFTVEEGVAGIPTAFIARYGEGGHVVGLLAEYDALPGMSQDTVPFKQSVETSFNGHACGHNLLGTGAVAGAVAISKWLAQGHEGTVVLYGCPAEEGGSGKAYMVREGCFDGVDAVLSWHPAGENGVGVQGGLANVQIDFRFHGRSSHASSAPEAGRSALDAVEAFNYMMNLMREHVPMTSRIHYIITDGGQSANVVPDYAEVEYFLRSPKREIVEQLKTRAIKAAEGAAMGTGTTMTYEIKSGNYETLYNLPLGKLVQRNLEVVGGVEYNDRERKFAEKVLKTSGIDDMSVLDVAGQIVPLAEEKETLTGASSDVGNVSWVVPTIGFTTASFIPGSKGHCWQQTAVGGMSIGTKGMMNTAKVMYLTALDLMKSPKKIEQVKQDFNKRRPKGFVFQPLIGDRKPPLDYRKR